MTKNSALALALLAMLAACGNGDGTNPVNRPGGDDDNGKPENPIEPAPTPGTGVPDSLALNVSDISYDLANDQLVVTMSGLDGQEEEVNFQRDNRLDVPGYLVYSQQDDPSDRMYVAVAQESANGDVRASAISDGGQFTVFYSGTHYERDGNYTAPTSGLVSYAGKYAGVSNFDDPNGDELKTPLPDPSLRPAQPSQTTGDIFLNVSFSDNQVNGAIYNKTYLHDNTVDLPDVFLTDGKIDGNGEFFGVAEESTEVKTGNFGGIISSDQQALAGTVVIEEDVGGGVLRENGAFVLPLCTDNTGACANVNSFK